MDIGLHTGLLTKSYVTGGPTIAQETQDFDPIPGILDAPNVVILGASIMDGAFGGSQTTRASIQAFAQAIGFTGTVWARSQAGEQIFATTARHAQVVQETAIAATQGQNLYLVHTGGNNVSGSRPWPGNQTQFANDYETLMQQITATDAVIPMPLTKRLYTTAPEVLHGDVASEANGSKPYNDNIIYPAVAQYAPEWWDGAAPYVNPYETADAYPQLLNADGVHGYAAALGRYVLMRVAARALGIAPGQSRAGTSILYSPQLGDPSEITVGPINTFKSYGQANFTNKPLLYGAVTTAGTLDPYIELVTNDEFQNGSNNAGTDTYARIPDARFHDEEIVNRGIYVQGTKTYELSFAGLIPGDTVTVSAVGVRNAGGTNRRGRLSLSTGQSLDLDASNVAASNQVTFDPVTVPADGKLTLGLAVVPGATYAYLHGVMLDFS